jgi:hypothetical protein
LKGFEPALRAQRFSNVWLQNQGTPYKVSTFNTTQYTAGLNYYIKGHNAKIQANYDIVRDPRGDSFYRFHHVKNDFFSMNFQVMW